jgi:ABC-type branched-subunit amino acid transport system substrate-binding protein
MAHGPAAERGLMRIEASRRRDDEERAVQRRGRWSRAGAVLLVLVLLASACDDGVDDEESVGPGVSAEACPNAVDEGNGCIYLGTLSDLTQGPFAALGVEVVDGQRDFWQRVNDQGGIGGYEIDVDQYTRDTHDDPDRHAAAYDEIEPEVLALASTMGTASSRPILEDMDEDDMVGVPASWWSGWDFERADHGVMLGSGYSYCLEAQIGLDWLAEDLGSVGEVMSVGYPGGYGDDGAAGAQAWAEATGAEFAGFVQTQPNQVAGGQDEVVHAIVDARPDVVQLGVGPAETGEIVVKAAARGFEGMFLGSAPTWDPALVADSDVAQVLQSLFRYIAPWEGFEGESAAHEAMREAKGDGWPANDGYTFGWVWSYPLKAALEAAAEAGDLSREGLRDALDGLEVDYEGALDPRTYGGDPTDDVPRVAVISAPDPDAPLGLTVLESGVTGPTADAYDYDEACAE